MTHLLVSSQDELERVLLSSAELDGPPPEAVANAALALGIGISVAAGTATMAAASKSTLVQASHVGASKVSLLITKLATVQAVKYLAMGALLIGSGVGAVVLVNGSESPGERPLRQARTEPTASLSVQTQEAHQAPPIPTVDPGSLPIPTVDPGSLPEETGKPSSLGLGNRNPRGVTSEKVRSDDRPSSPSSETSALAEELKLLDQARGALATRRPGAALEALDSYALRFPSGALALESQVLRVQALSQKGDKTRAAVLARELLSNPSAVRYSERLRQIVGNEP